MDYFTAYIAQPNLIPTELIDENIADKYGNELRVKWMFIEMKDESMLDKINDDNKNGIRYQELVF